MPRRAKVLQAITRMIVGGAQAHALSLCERLDPRRFQVDLLTGPELGPEGDLLTRARSRVPTTVVPCLGREIRPSRDVRAYRLIAGHLKQGGYDIVHTNTSKAGILARLAAHRAGVPVILHTVHGWQWTPARRSVMNRFIIETERWAARFTDRLIVVAEEDRKKGLAAGVGREDQYVLIESAIPLDRFDPAVADGGPLRARLRIPEEAPVVGTVGRFAYQKAPEVMLNAARRILETHPEAHFVYVGDGPLRTEVLGAMGDFAEHPRLHLVGILEDVVPAVAAFDVFLLSSRYEGLPRVVVEAMALGKPVASTPADGVVEVVRDGETGCIVPHGDADALAGAALAFLGDPARSRAMGATGRRVALERFDLDSMVRRTEDLYARLLAGAGLPLGDGERPSPGGNPEPEVVQARSRSDS